MPSPADSWQPTRRHCLAGLGASGLAITLAACSDDDKWHNVDVSGSVPPLQFAMTRAADGKAVTQADYRGRIVMIYFGYTYCPDLCPTTLSNIATILERLGKAAHDVSVLFVTVDPNRDTLPVLTSYVKAFAPEIAGLRGTPDELARFARRYRVVYSVTPATATEPYEVTHSSVIYVFDRSGNAQLLIPSLATTKPDLAGATADLERMIAAPATPGWIARLRRLV